MTIKDIAKESGYAISTVSRALNGHPDVSEEARLRIQQVVKEKGFVPNANARRLKCQQLKAVVVIVKGTHNLFLTGMLAQLQQLVKQAGFDSVIRFAQEGENEVALAARICQELKPKGIVFIGGEEQNFRTDFHRVKVPCVLATSGWGRDTYENLSTVWVDDRSAAEAGMDFLLENGHRSILLLGAEPEEGGPNQLRVEGCRSSLEKHGLSEKVCLIRKPAAHMAGGYQAMTEFLEEDGRATAVFAMSDALAAGAARAVADHGLRVPEEISVMGFDGTALAEFFLPRLAAMRQPAEEIIQVSAECLLASVVSKKPAQHRRLKAELVPGASVKKL